MEKLETPKTFLSHRKQRVSVNGTLSDDTCVTSGVPQGSVLGPIIFLLFINDINNNIQSPIRLFADDSIIYRKIKSETDNNILQSHLIQLQTWSNKWQMEFNIPKCVHLPITPKPNPDYIRIPSVVCHSPQSSATHILELDT